MAIYVKHMFTNSLDDLLTKHYLITWSHSKFQKLVILDHACVHMHGPISPASSTCYENLVLSKISEQMC